VQVAFPGGAKQNLLERAVGSAGASLRMMAQEDVILKRIDSASVSIKT
jgi:hypothetical protein